MANIGRPTVASAKMSFVLGLLAVGGTQAQPNLSPGQCKTASPRHQSRAADVMIDASGSASSSSNKPEMRTSNGAKIFVE